jgi:two-component system OmpR family response regulator
MARAPVRVLLVDQEGLVGSLEALGLVTAVASWLDDQMVANVAGFDAVMLGVHGHLGESKDACQRWREKGYLGAILALCADATEGEALLEAGADDFVTTPFEVRELVTRIRACARRAEARSRLRWGPLELDRVHRIARVRGRSIALTARECELLVCLIEAGDGVASRAHLRERVLQGKEDKGSNLVEVHLSRLRDKLGEDAAIIETVRRSGYKLRR